MLQAVLRNVPEYWDAANYDSSRYHLFEVNNRDSEYIIEIEPFTRDRVGVTTLKRIQNPFQYGRFRIRKEQKEFRNNIVQKIKCYHCIQIADLNIALEHNLDVRRYVHKDTGCHSENKNPKFYRNPIDAYNSVSYSDKVILICETLGPNIGSKSFVLENDSEYMPLYVAYVS